MAYGQCNPNFITLDFSTFGFMSSGVVSAVQINADGFTNGLWKKLAYGFESSVCAVGHGHPFLTLCLWYKRQGGKYR